MKGFLLSSLLFFVGAVTAMGQTSETDRWYFGVGGGFHTNWMRVTKIDETVYPSHKNNNSGVFSLWVRGAFGSENQFAIRPELDFLTRGGTLDKIYSNKADYYLSDDIKDIYYQVTGKYMDLRVPLMYRFGKKTSALRPYVMLVPVLGFCHSGSIVLEEQDYLFNKMDSYAYEGACLKATKANMAAVYFAAGIGGGVDWQFNINGRQFYLGAEAMYEFGFTDTYGDEASAAYKIQMDKGTPRTMGTRKYSGLELRVNIGIPFSVFKKRPKQVAEPVVEPVAEPQIVYIEKKEEPKVEEPLKPCYTLEEINEMMDKGASIEGKTICAIDDAINFDTNKSNIKKESYEYLDRLAITLIRTNSRIMVKGHTDNVGSEEYNLNLSKERAQSVVNYLVKKGVPRAKLAYDYYGMSMPLVSNDTEEGRRTNRRVEFEILK